MAVKVGLFVRLEAAQGKEDELEQFLTGAQALGEHPELFASPPKIEAVDVLASK